MNDFLKTPIGRLRLLAFLEGTSLLLLVFIAMPLKYFWHNPTWVKAIGPVHGGLFMIFVFYALVVGIGKKWKMMDMAWILLVGSFVPFGTFYIDRKFFKEPLD